MSREAITLGMFPTGIDVMNVFRHAGPPRVEGHRVRDAEDVPGCSRSAERGAARVAGEGYLLHVKIAGHGERVGSGVAGVGVQATHMHRRPSTGPGYEMSGSGRLACSRTGQCDTLPQNPTDLESVSRRSNGLRCTLGR